MRFYEYEAKQILKKHGVPVPKGELAKTGADAERIAKAIGGPVVLRPQVLFGREDATTKEAASPADAKKATEELLGREVRRKKPVGVLVEQAVKPVKTFALRTTFDGVVKRPVMIGTDAGGENLDDVADDQPERVHRRHYSALLPPSSYRAKELAKQMGLGGGLCNRMTRVAHAAADLLLRYDLTVLEINPLGQTEDGAFVALDAFMDMEIEGRARQKGILAEVGVDPSDTRSPRTPTQFDIDGAKIDADDPRGVAGPIVEFEGNLGCVIGAGGGSLTTFDAIKKRGGDPANYAAIGGNPSVRKCEALTKLVLSKPGVEKICVISNVVSNTRADLLARGVIKGVLALGKKPSDVITVFRAPGAWEEDAAKILKKYGIEHCGRDVSISEAAGRAVEKVGS